MTGSVGVPADPADLRVDYGTSAEVHRHALARALDAHRLPMETLWLGAFAIGADFGLVEIDAYLQGLMQLSPHQRDLLAHAMNEIQADVRLPGSEPGPAHLLRGEIDLLLGVDSDTSRRDHECVRCTRCWSGPSARRGPRCRS